MASETRPIEFYGKPEILAAAGAAILAWNRCEFTMLQMFSAMLKPSPIGEIVCHTSNNASRLEILRYTATRYGAPLSDLLVEFAVQYGICAENRNLIAHARLGVDALDFSTPVLRKMKSGSFSEVN